MGNEGSILDARINGLRDYLDAQMSAIRREIDHEHRIVEGRLESLNDVRSQLSVYDTKVNVELNKYVPREEYNAKHEGLIIDLRRVEGLFPNYAAALRVAAIESDVRELLEWRANMVGRVWAVIIGLGLLETLVSVAIGFILHMLGKG